MIFLGQRFDAGVGVVVHQPIGGERHTEGPPAGLGDHRPGDFLTPRAGANQQHRRIFFVAVVLAVELDEEPGPVLFDLANRLGGLGSPEHASQPGADHFVLDGFEFSAEAELRPGAAFPLLEGGEIDADDATGGVRDGNGPAEDGGDVDQEVILLLLAGDEPGDAGVHRLDEQRPLAAGEPTGGGVDAFDHVGLAAVGALVDAVVLRDARGLAVLLVEVGAALGSVGVVVPVGGFEIVADLLDLLTTTGDDAGPELSPHRADAQQGDQATQTEPANIRRAQEIAEQHRSHPGVWKARTEEIAG